MSDYGLATYSDNRQSINSKWPIFGPSYSQITNQFRNTNLIDLKTNELKYADLSVPPTTDVYEGWNCGTTYQQVFTDHKLVAEYKHGLGFLPICYYTIVGEVKRRTEVVAKQTINTGSTSSYGGNFVRSAVVEAGAYSFPKHNQMSSGNEWGDDDGVLLDDMVLVARDSDIGYGDLYIPSDAPFPMLYYERGWTTRSGLIDVKYNEEYYNDIFYVEVDENYVRIYERVWWVDELFHLTKTGYDITQRFTGMESYTGSNLNITVQIIPYKLEDLT